MSWFLTTPGGAPAGSGQIPCRLTLRGLHGNGNQDFWPPTSLRGRDPLQSHPSLEWGLKYPPVPGHQSCCQTQRQAVRLCHRPTPTWTSDPYSEPEPEPLTPTHPHTRVSRHEYSFVSSEPLGREQYKEMYLFVYRKDVVSVVDTYQYPDPEDVFSREPFVVKFSAPGCAARELVLVPLHAAPHQAVAEIDALYDVYLDVIDKWGTDDLVFLGDFNADCSYVRAQDWAAIRLRSSEVFKWLIQDNADTTVGNSDCAYDRIVVCGSRLRRSLKPQSATVHDFQEEFGLDQTQALAISDHFPVEVTFKSH
ncbi:deoxyribonuclease-1-like 2 isoform X2 [Manis pentadactyla]|uniref:deoxyribonuclease-1-like 2 isoform X2 n=1 Tax=Manis pentadactyla TaxID=143292 RepID=UPI00255C69F9|nr:deoxyribonuclease-1-like 2 isoform X2 [Manis pentadactyla]